MSTGGDDDVDYESDPEEAKRSLTMRRREASDDEEGDANDRESEGPPRRGNSRDGIESDEEYYDDEGEEVEEDCELEDGVVEEREVNGLADGLGDGGVVEVVNEESESVNELGKVEVAEEGKKENEPFAVPTAGAFYMHDDRFRSSARGRNRRMLGGRKLWESQNESKWGHDKFEEITVQDRHYNEGARNSRGRYRGRGRNRGGGRGNSRGGRSKVYETYNQDQVPKIIKGRGVRHYDFVKRNDNESPQVQYRQRSSKSVENPSHAASSRAPTASQDVESGPVSSAKQAFASSLNSASPPFYPSGSSTKETATWVQKKDTTAGNSNRNSRSADVVENVSVAMNKLHINDSVSSNIGKFPMSAASNAHIRAQGRGVVSSGQMPFQPVASHSQTMRASTPSHTHNMQKSYIHNGRQSSAHQPRQFSAGGSQNSSTAREDSTLNSFERGELESSKFKSALVVKEKGSVQGGGKGSFMYDGSQGMSVASNMSSGHGDQNFAAPPAFLPVMPFGSQHHPGGMGVPAVGMAFPGYVSQPNGLGNSEMTWLPVLAGAAGALGSAYGSSYIAALESAYQSRSSSQLTSSSGGASSKESNGNKLTNEWQPSQTPEVTNDEVGQRQKITRRYTEMKFGQ